ncbi:ATP-binding protein [Niallia sp. Krafla_26]|uniref:ATP-binding protein n=1 Tax=Niallia sp. Krafla_26 TaxID=3064703 RepID=UPI003D172D60
MQLNGKGKNSDDITLDRLAAVGQIAAGIAHEVRNPLTAVKGFLDLLKEENPHDYIDIAVEELERALLTMQNLLNVSKPDLDEERFSLISLTAELESILYLFQNQTYHVTIEKYFRDTQIKIYGKRNQLKKALFNLIKNAFEAMPEKGTLTVKHYRTEGKIIVSIEDTGIGIPKEKLNLLGTPFFTSKETGTGMGLTQVFSTVYDHQGKLQVDSVVGKGTQFLIEFPIQEMREIGVVKLNLIYQENQSFTEFYEANKEMFMKQLLENGRSLFDSIAEIESSSINEEYILQSAQKVISYLNDDDEFGLILHAKEHGRTWAEMELELILKLDWIQTIRKTYWDYLYNYYEHLEISKKEIFEVERKVNFTLDSFIKHFSASYSEYNAYLISAQNELIDDLNVPVIPLSPEIAILPIIGMVDTKRAKNIQYKVLEEIYKQNLKFIVLDLSGVSYMDTAVLTHLFNIVNGIRIQGCKTVLTGVRPEITNTIVELGIELNGKVETKGTLQQAIKDLNLV